MRRAFTLTEVLVVVAVIALLLAIMMPTLGQVKSIGRQAKCASNLHQIYNAWTLRKNAEQFRVTTVGFAWQMAMLGQMANAQQVFKCTEDTSDQVFTAKSLSSLRVAVYNSGSFTNFLYDMELEEGPLCQIRNASAGYYELWFEDIRPGGGDMDFNDIILKVNTTAGTITIGTQAAGYHFDLIDAATRDVMLHDLARAGEGATGTVFSLMGRGRSSYAMNVSEGLKEKRNDRIMLLDYVKPIADNNPGSSECANWWANPPDGMLDRSTRLPEFARHMGKLNVVFDDGSLQLVSPYAIDPVNPTLQATYWSP
jgi:prepilin-type N-terminal cleavage/methylation domain-containing protein